MPTDDNPFPRRNWSDVAAHARSLEQAGQHATADRIRTLIASAEQYEAAHRHSQELRAEAEVRCGVLVQQLDDAYAGKEELRQSRDTLYEDRQRVRNELRAVTAQRDSLAAQVEVLIERKTGQRYAYSFDLLIGTHVNVEGTGLVENDDWVCVIDGDRSFFKARPWQIVTYQAQPIDPPGASQPTMADAVSQLNRLFDAYDRPDADRLEQAKAILVRAGLRLAT